MSRSLRLTNNVTLTSQDRESYAQTGVLLIEQLFTDAGVKLLIKATQENFQPADHTKEFIPGFDRFSNQFLSRTSWLPQLVDELSGFLKLVMQNDVVLTQAMILEMKPGSPGFLWHFDEFSFCFVRAEDMAFTLWIPLIPIRTQEQHGGLLWVNQNDFSARSRMQQWAFYQKQGLQTNDPDNRYHSAKHQQYGENWAGEYDHEMFGDLQQECDMQLGDALLFNRYTWHKTHEIRPGPIPCRTAIVLAGCQRRCVIRPGAF